MDLPLDGVKVLDLSRILAGPWCAMVLGDLGAEVTKVEHPERGDDTRQWGLRTGPSNTTYFDSVNRNKRSVSIDLASPEGLAQVKALARDSDVLIHNFKVGGAEKLGLGHANLALENPRLIYCSVSGYPPDGPEARRPGYDLVAQGETGLMAINGEAGTPPLKFGIAAVDLFTGQFAAQAILAALFQRERTGKGRQIQLALYDSGVALSSYYGLEALALGREPARYGNDHPAIVPYGVFPTADGPIVLTVGNNAQFERFCTEVIERPELAADPRFATNLERSRHRDILVPILKQALSGRTRKELLTRLAACGIPSGEVLGLHEALTSDRARAAGSVAEAGGGRVLAPPYRFDGERLPVRLMPPPLAGKG